MGGILTAAALFLEEGYERQNGEQSLLYVKGAGRYGIMWAEVINELCF